MNLNDDLAYRRTAWALERTQLAFATYVYIQREHGLALAAQKPILSMPVAVPLPILVTLFCAVTAVLLYSGQ